MISRAAQCTGVVLTFAVVAAFNRHTDGLWLQGDAPRHAVNGLFWWDLLRAFPTDPVGFAIRYYARYPVIAPATYPPLFYLLEGFVFAMVGPSPYAARVLVLVFGMIAGMYTMAWARRWIDQSAGWVGAFLAFLPGVVLWSNAVMLNVPAMAFGLASLYHCRRWSDSRRSGQLVAAIAFMLAALLTYYPAAVFFCVAAVWSCRRTDWIRWPRAFPPALASALIVSIPFGLVLWLAPVHIARQLPTLAFLTQIPTWTFYWTSLVDVVGGPAELLGLAGLAAAGATRVWRTEAALVAAWIVVVIALLSLLPVRDPRYLLPVAPAFALAAALGVASAGRALRSIRPEWQVAALVATLAAGVVSAARVPVPQVSGYRELAIYLQEHGPHDAVLYDGAHNGLFGFYMRAMDPAFERRMARADKLVFEYGPTTTFEWVQRSNVASAIDVVNLLRARSGCRWVAIERSNRPSASLGRRLLQETVTRPEFEFVRSFATPDGGEPRRVDLYRIVGDVVPIESVDLNFPSFSNHTFTHVIPIS
jgi:hypothetical protein